MGARLRHGKGKHVFLHHSYGRDRDPNQIYIFLRGAHPAHSTVQRRLIEGNNAAKGKEKVTIGVDWLVVVVEVTRQGFPSYPLQAREKRKFNTQGSSHVTVIQLTTAIPVRRSLKISQS